MSTTISVPTTARVTFGLLAYLPRFGTHVNLEWDSREPYAVAFAFEQPGGVTVTRHADREVLSRVSNDRTAHTHGFAAYLALGRAVLAWDAEVVVSIDGGMLGRFLLTTYAACPLGAEDVDVDGLIAQILEETP